MADVAGSVGSVWVPMGDGVQVVKEAVTLSQIGATYYYEGTLAHGNAMDEGLFDSSGDGLSLGYWVEPNGGTGGLGRLVVYCGKDGALASVKLTYRYWPVFAGTYPPADNTLFEALGFYGWSAENAADPIDVTDFYKARVTGCKRFILGQIRWSASAQKYWRNDDLPIDWASLGDRVLVKFYVKDSDATKGTEGQSDTGKRWEGWGTVTGIDIEAAPGRAIETPIRFTGSGRLIHV